MTQNFTNTVLSHIKDAWNVMLKENMTNKKKFYEAIYSRVCNMKIISLNYFLFGKSKIIYYIQNDTFEKQTQEGKWNHSQLQQKFKTGMAQNVNRATRVCFSSLLQNKILHTFFLVVVCYLIISMLYLLSMQLTIHIHIIAIIKWNYITFNGISHGLSMVYVIISWGR